MINRAKILFKINGEVVVEDSTNLDLNEIDRMKWVIVHECECLFDDIEVEVIETPKELSDYDVSKDGLINFKDIYFKEVTMVRCVVDVDTLLDNLSKGKLDESFDLC